MMIVIASLKVVECGSLGVHILQCGFALLEAGTVRSKNMKNILLKVLLAILLFLE